MHEKELRNLCIDAVISRATKQKPLIQQIKILKNEKNGKVTQERYSRGVAFIEFSAHQPNTKKTKGENSTMQQRSSNA